MTEKLFIAVLMSLSLAFSSHAQSLNSQNLSREQAFSDVDFYFQTIRQVHPKPFYFASEATCDSVALAIKSDIADSINSLDLLKQLERQTNALYDAHTGIPYFSYTLRVIPEQAGLFPFELQEIGDALCFEKEGEWEELRLINGVPIGRVVDEMSSLLKADFPKTVRNSYLQKYFRPFYYSLYGSQSSFEIVSLRKGEWHKGDYAALMKAELPAQLAEGEQALAPYSLAIYPNQRLALLRINTFALNQKEDFELFISRSFESITRSATDLLFVDLRANSGGSDLLVNRLMDHLFEGDYRILFGYVQRRGEQYGVDWQRKSNPPNRYKGRLALLQSHETASAAMDFSSAMKTSGRALILGQETRDPAYSFSNSESFVLPHSQLPFSVATGFFAMPGAGQNSANGIEPDVYYDWTSPATLDAEHLNKLRHLLSSKCRYYFEKY